MADLQIDFCGVPFINPFTVAASPSSDSREKAERALSAGWGGIVFKTVSTPAHAPCLVRPNMAGLPYGNRPQAHLYNIDLISERSMEQIMEDIVFLKQRYPDRRLIGSIMAATDEEWETLVGQLESAGADMIECSMSCPQGERSVSGDREISGMIPAANRGLMEQTTRRIKAATKKGTPVIVKLTPNVTDITHIAMGAAAGGADAVCAIDTVRGFMGLDLRTGRPKLAVEGLSTWGGLSGPAVKPIALGCVSRIAKALPIPIAGVGGISTWEDAAEFILLGASNVQLCTAISRYGFDMIRGLTNGLAGYMAQRGCTALVQLVGASLPYLVDYTKLNPQARRTAHIQSEACVRCGCCITACTDAGYGALSASADRQPMLDTARCKGCGICQSVCPKSCIELRA